MAASRKPRINTHVSHELHARLMVASKRPGLTQTEIVEAALAAFLSPERDDQRDAAIIRRLDRMTRQFGRMERDQLILAETMALFIRLFLTLTPPVPEADKDAARATGKERFDYFIDQLGRQLVSGRRVLEEALEEFTAEADDFFSLRDLEEKRENGHA